MAWETMERWVRWGLGVPSKMGWVKERVIPDISEVLCAKERIGRIIELWEILSKLESLYRNKTDGNATDDEDVWRRGYWSRKRVNIRKRGGDCEEITELEEQLRDYWNVFTEGSVYKFVEIGWADFFFNNLDLFEEFLDKKLAIKLIKLGYVDEVFQNKDMFIEFEINQDISDILIEEEMYKELFDHIGDFEQEVQRSSVRKCIEKWASLKIWNRLSEVPCFNVDDIEEIFEKMLSKWVEPSKVREFSDNYFENIQK